MIGKDIMANSKNCTLKPTHQVNRFSRVTLVSLQFRYKESKNRRTVSYFH